MKLLEEDPTFLEDNSDAVAGSGGSCWKIIRMQLLEVDEVTGRGSDVAGR